ncbi:hypothetical protein GCM10023340_28160 [Nocardioides marinquilinus]|uniref:FHA domain-containing protein n=1 Tax=Nocardioides marinquilinus TaxID=1210400 RepID=A0ABP9PSG7_9ACTN
MTGAPRTCPAGHVSLADDYCDTCGVAMDAAPPATSPPAAPSPAEDPHVDDTGLLPPGADAAEAGTVCPSCSTANPADALFCENCGYDFTTGAMPRPPTPVMPPPSAPPGPSASPGSPPSGTPSSVPPPTPATGATSPSPAATTPPPVPASANPSPALAEPWVAEVWIDPDWYADQQSTDRLPSPGLPTVVPLRQSSLLIGRASRSRGILPDLDLGSDPGISRRHAQLTGDGTRWFVEDLGSSNGTYVGGALGVLPRAPVPQGQRVEVRPDERVYLGAWTRIVIRKATPGEV